MLFCQAAMTEEDKYDVYSSGLQVPVCCMEQPRFSSWEFSNTESAKARIELNPL